MNYAVLTIPGIIVFISIVLVAKDIYKREQSKKVKNTLSANSLNSSQTILNKSENECVLQKNRDNKDVRMTPDAFQPNFKKETA